MTETKSTMEYLGREVFVTIKDIVLRNLPHRRVSCCCDDATLRIDIYGGRFNVILLDEPDSEGFATVEVHASWGRGEPHTEFYASDSQHAFWLGFACEKLGISIPIVKKVGFYKPEV